MTEKTVRGERQIDCIRISGLSSGTLGFRAMMEFARAEATDRAASKTPGRVVDCCKYVRVPTRGGDPPAGINKIWESGRFTVLKTLLMPTEINPQVSMARASLLLAGFG